MNNLKKFNFKKLPLDIIYQIFGFLIFNMYNENYIDYNEKSNINNYLLVSRNFNINFIYKIKSTLNIYFNIQIINDRSCNYNFWKDLIFTLLIEKFKLDDEEYILERMKKQNNDDIEKKLFFIYQRSEFIYNFLSRNWLSECFKMRYNFLVFHKSTYRNSLNKNSRISPFGIKLGAEYGLFKFRKFYKRYIINNYIYSPRNIKRKRNNNEDYDIEMRENKRISLKKKLKDYYIDYIDKKEINDINHLVKKNK
jgi:hypothetical protein